jgi:hypothetical protein
VLHRLRPAFTRAARPGANAYTEPDAKAQAADARALARHVFPRAFGLRAAFSAPPAGTNDAAQGAGRTPRRLVRAVGLMEQMLWFHAKCGYVPLRDVACPSKVRQPAGTF